MSNGRFGERRGWFCRGYLPHYDAEGLIQHVTFHLADSLPESAIERIEYEIEGLPNDEQKVERRKRIHRWIDAGHGCCILDRPVFAEMVQDTFLHFHNSRYHLHAWVVMPNHVHVLFRLLADWPLSKIVASWKKFTARRIRDFVRAGIGVGSDQEIGRLGKGSDLEIDGPSGKGANQETATPSDGPRMDLGLPSLESLSPVWHREYWDRFIRDANHYCAAVAYIHNNPVAAGLVARPEDWPWSSATIPTL